MSPERVASEFVPVLHAEAARLGALAPLEERSGETDSDSDVLALAS
ncbi:MAG: hypothetical protein MI723_15650 [Caulobacterales bacterium]|nr:hypothetical protein [Caulobacterales bacterium]